MELQRLPLPVGSPHPVRRPRRQRPAPSRALAALGLLAAGAGALLGALPPPLSAGLENHAYQVGGVSLPARGGGVYAGPQGAMVLIVEPTVVRAGASTEFAGQPMIGSCAMIRGARAEHCRFWLGSQRLEASDRLQGNAWLRTYSDGEQVRIALVGGPVPVPFPLGR